MDSPTLEPPESPIFRAMMKKIALIAFAFAFVATAQASARTTLQVDRPQKGLGARVTHVRLINGIVRHRMQGLVLTDTRCNPDRNRVSHCLNVIRLGNGKTILVVHDHRMMNMPCLSPGEHIVLRPA